MRFLLELPLLALLVSGFDESWAAALPRVLLLVVVVLGVADDNPLVGLVLRSFGAHLFDQRHELEPAIKRA